ncbi:COG1361 S-layer family protein [Vulcanisaeta thermophila]|uniref:COG1361 S-layer family protein n=1 Tax=Vulcanisaeta thermophila TaxID=867917 RepID=UPI000853EEDF|nr:hypothetical protein [Vulcanisaeta thermophila]
MSKKITKKSKRYLIITVIIALALAMTVVAQQYYNTAPPFSIVNIETIPSPSTTGISKVTITLLYIGGNYLYNTEFQLTTCSGTVVSRNPVFIGWLSPGQEVTISYLINSTLPINCQATLTASWAAEYEASPRAQITTYIEVSGSGSTTINFPLVIYGTPDITISTNTTSVVSNMVNPVKILIVNNGSGPIYNLQVTVTPQGAVMSGVTNVISIGTLNPGGRYGLVLYLIPTSTGPISLNIAYSGIDQSGGSINGAYTISLGVVTASPSQVLVFPVNSSLTVGLGRIILGIRNTNPVPIDNVTLVLTSVSGVNLMGTTTYEITSIMPGSTYYLEIPIAVSITSSSATITYALSYQYSNGYPASTQGSLSLTVLSTPSILVTGYQIAPTPTRVGNVTSVSLNFVNTGPIPAYNLNVTIIPGPGVRVISQSSTYMGTLNPQQLGAVAFSFIPTRPGNTTITFLIQYVDQYGQSHNVYYTVPITVTGNATFTTSPIGAGASSGQGYYYRRPPVISYVLIGIAVLAVVIIVVIVLVLRRVGRK